VIVEAHAVTRLGRQSLRKPSFWLLEHGGGWVRYAHVVNSTPRHRSEGIPVAVRLKTQGWTGRVEIEVLSDEDDADVVLLLLFNVRAATFADVFLRVDMVAVLGLYFFVSYVTACGSNEAK
jgi:hypothetical protein